MLVWYAQTWSVQLLTPASQSHGILKLREALRGMRHVLRISGNSINDTLSSDVLPSPAADLASIALRKSNRLAKRVDSAASRLGKKALGVTNQTIPSLQSFAGQKDGGLAFSVSFYAGTQTVLKQLNAEGMFVSELNACKAFKQADMPEDADAAAAAKLIIDLHEANVLTGLAYGPARIPQSLIEPVTLFAVVLWLQSNRSETEDEAALSAAIDISIAISVDIGKAFLSRDQTALAALFSEFIRHV